MDVFDELKADKSKVVFFFSNVGVLRCWCQMISNKQEMTQSMSCILLSALSWALP